jgi:hypothetical protein
MTATSDGKVNFEINDLNIKTDELKTLTMIATQNMDQTIKFQLWIEGKKCIGVKSLNDLKVSNKFWAEIRE